jgi:hypothetical protein
MKRMDIESLFQRHKSYIASYCEDVKGSRLPGIMVSILRAHRPSCATVVNILLCHRVSSDRPWPLSRLDVFGRVATSVRRYPNDLSKVSCHTPGLHIFFLKKNFTQLKPPIIVYLQGQSKVHILS